MSDNKSSNQLFCDLRTDKEKSAFFLSGRAYETGVIARALQNDVAMAYHRCSEYQQEIERLRADLAAAITSYRTLVRLQIGDHETTDCQHKPPQRYDAGLEGDICGAVIDMRPHPAGDWVLWSDVEHLFAGSAVKTPALHLVQCCQCKAEMRLPYTNESRTAVSLQEAGGWFFSTDTGWLCPKDAPPENGGAE